MMEKQKKLVSLLLKKTRKGELDWAEAIGRNTFQVSLKDNSIRIHASPNDIDETSNDYHISLINNEGKVVDSFSDVEVGETASDARDQTLIYGQFRDLYDLARRTALGSEKLLNELLTELDDDEVPF